MDKGISDAVFGVYETEVIVNVFSLKIQLNSLKIECKFEPEAVKHEADCFTVSCTGKSIGFALYLSSSWGKDESILYSYKYLSIFQILPVSQGQGLNPAR